MSDIAIRVESIGKRFSINTSKESYKTLRDSIANVTLAPFRALKSLVTDNGNVKRQNDIIWALKDVSFEVKTGEVVGLIGRNGAGKSTLLKILARVMEPTEGYAEIAGKVGSLLEVGVGFHLELSGRENIYLNGAILGMKRADIKRRFDAIVAFAEIEKFIDTPVKHYSSGMYLRLAFAVAAHLEPEILLVDEVLAVGDAAFQKKCIGKMEQVAGEGRTVLFVSHNMAAVQALCTRGIFLHNGSIYTDSTASGAVSAYLKMLERGVSQNLLERTDRRGKGEIKLARIEISTGAADPSVSLATGRSAQFAFYLTAHRPRTSCIFTIYDDLGQPLATFNSAVRGPHDSHDASNGTSMICFIDELPLVPGRYRVNVAISIEGELQDHLEGAAFFEVEQGALRGRPVIKGKGYGRICLQHQWRLPPV
ncbi:MAG TPA: ABC transporter ATP-binding protein [Pyrinomonadaceae bacterium]|nr:ABC transporter ATP-binding protein [Pyrinomonadaceae bacterium]